MQYALTAAEALRAEQEAIAHGAVTLETLMDRAGDALAETILDAAPSGPIAVLTGKGNNAGDGWVAARLLHEQGRDVRVFALASPSALSGAAKTAARAAVDRGVAWSTPDSALDLAHGLLGVTVILDALFGSGFRGTAAEPYASAITAIEDSDAFVVAADMPSGVHADTAVVVGPAVNANITVTFSAPKIGLLLEPGASHAGEIIVSDIGVPGVYVDRAGCLEIWDRGDYRGLMPVPVPGDHKGTRGRVLTVTGSRAFAGAAVLTARGASRMGAGYVFAAVPASIVPTVQSALPHVICHSMAETLEGTLARAAADALLELAAHVDAVVVGPGLTLHPETVEVVRRLVAETRVPLVLDADALNAFDAIGPAVILSRSAPTVVTPHPGELARLLDRSTLDIQADRIASAAMLSGGQVACLLKGARTIVAGDGRAVVTMAGNPGMATAGMGDVLAGMIGTLLAQGLSPYDAAALGAYMHGRAGDLGADELTQICLTADDIDGFLPQAVHEVLGV
ncbi:MAG: NAD(P)H-hydrate dehydratase [Coriobacteriia bacterium]|nr:NAD(P)H-hydrate dehydratase [Coriobacteriia bacterium]